MDSTVTDPKPAPEEILERLKNGRIPRSTGTIGHDDVANYIEELLAENERIATAFTYCFICGIWVESDESCSHSLHNHLLELATQKTIVKGLQEEKRRYQKKLGKITSNLKAQNAALQELLKKWREGHVQTQTFWPGDSLAKTAQACANELESILK